MAVYNCRKGEGDMEIVAALKVPVNSTNGNPDQTIAHLAACECLVRPQIVSFSGP